MSAQDGGGGPRLSVCMIARNEAAILGQALESVRSLADEIVVVDTGSEDDTAQLARSLGAVVAHFPWTNDFSAARNASLQAATGDWVLILDADELIQEQDHALIAALLRGPRTAAYMLEQRSYTDRTDVLDWIPNDGRHSGSCAYAGYVSIWQVRLVPRDLRVRYAGAVHEETDASLRAAGYAIEHRPIVVHHFGKVREAAVMARKQELYTRLGEQKVLHSPQSPRALYELAVQYAEVGRRDEAQAALERFLTMGAEPFFRGRAAAILGQLYLQRGEPARAVDVLERGVREHPVLVSLWHTLAHALDQSGQRARAVLVLEQALAIFEDHVTLRAYLGMLYLELRQWDVAHACFTAVRERFPASPAARAGLALQPLLRRGVAGLTLARPWLQETSAAQRQTIAQMLVRAGQTPAALAVLLDASAADRAALLPELERVAGCAGDPWSAAAAACARSLHETLTGAERAATARRWLGASTLGSGLALLHPAGEVEPGLLGLRAAALARLGCPALARAGLSALRARPGWADAADRILATLPSGAPASPGSSRGASGR
jgi:tetratricopeptide (TPR) repeat protein